MDRIIGKISVIEEESASIMEEAAAKKKEIAEQIRQETEDFDQKLEEATASRIDEMRASMEADMRKKLTEQKNRADRALRRLEQHYENHRKAYIEQMFEEMTGE